MLRDRERECLLLDYYGELLTEHQYGVLDEYFNEDLSMNEIAENYGISKSAVQDLIRRSLNQLNEYEDLGTLKTEGEMLEAGEGRPFREYYVDQEDLERKVIDLFYDEADKQSED